MTKIRNSKPCDLREIKQTEKDIFINTGKIEMV